MLWLMYSGAECVGLREKYKKLKFSSQAVITYVNKVPTR